MLDGLKIYYPKGAYGLLTFREEPAAGTAPPDTGTAGAKPPLQNGAAQAAADEAKLQDKINEIVAREVGKTERKLTGQVKTLEEELATARKALEAREEEAKSIKSVLESFSPPGKDDAEADRTVYDEYEAFIKPPAEIKGAEARALYVLWRKQQLANQEHVSGLSKTSEEQANLIKELRAEHDVIKKERADHLARAQTAERNAKIREVVSELRPPETKGAAEALALVIDSRVTRDEQTGRFMFKVADDEFVALTASNVAKYIPENLLAPAQQGGSGATPPASPTPSAGDVATLQAAYNTAMEEAKKDPRNSTKLDAALKLRNQLWEAKQKQKKS